MFLNFDDYNTHEYRFLEKAVSLTSLTISNILVAELYHVSLYEFIATHRTLTSFKLKVYVHMSLHEFFYVYEMIVRAMLRNKRLNVLNFNCAVFFDDDFEVADEEISTLVSRVSELSRILQGRDVMINGVHVDRIINDLQGDDETTEALKALGLTFMIVGESISNDGDA